jgi:hypothetical protein
VAGGVGIGGNLNIGGVITVTGAVIIRNTATSTSTTTGALIVTGGVGIGGNLNIGGVITATTATLSGTVLVTSTSTASSTTTGALQVVGGAGIRGDLYVGGSIYQNGVQVGFGNSNISSSGTTSTFLIDNFTKSTGTNTGALQVRGGVGIGGSLYAGVKSYVGGAEIITSATISTFQTLKGQYLPRVGNSTGTSLTIDASAFDNYVFTATGNVTNISFSYPNNYVAFDGQKFIIKIFNSPASSYTLNWSFGTNQFKIVGASPPQITSPSSVIYLGAMYSSQSNTWDILSVVVS